MRVGLGLGPGLLHLGGHPVDDGLRALLFDLLGNSVRKTHLSEMGRSFFWRRGAVGVAGGAGTAGFSMTCHAGSGFWRWCCFVCED